MFVALPLCLYWLSTFILSLLKGKLGIFHLSKVGCGARAQSFKTYSLKMFMTTISSYGFYLFSAQRLSTYFFRLEGRSLNLKTVFNAGICVS